MIWEFAAAPANSFEDVSIAEDFGMCIILMAPHFISAKIGEQKGLLRPRLLYVIGTTSNLNALEDNLNAFEEMLLDRIGLMRTCRASRKITMGIWEREATPDLNDLYYGRHLTVHPCHVTMAPLSA